MEVGEVFRGGGGMGGGGGGERSLYGLDSDVSKHFGEKYQVKEYLTDVILFLGGIVGWGLGAGGGAWGS